MRKLLIGGLVAAALPALTACGSAVVSSSVEDGSNLVAADGTEFGDDASTWSNDQECDDPRFEGPGMTATPLLEEDVMHDATDCLEAYERGDLTLR